MSGKLSQPESGLAFGKPACCPSETALLKTTVNRQTESSANNSDPKGKVHIGAFKRWLLWFLTFFGIYASSSMCPFCGTPGCPVGVGGAALVGGIFAGLWQYGHSVFRKGKEVVQRLFR